MIYFIHLYKTFVIYKNIHCVYQFSAAYLNWRQLNLDQEHRFQMGQSWWGCYLLDAYYRWQLNNQNNLCMLGLLHQFVFVFRMGEYMDSSSRMRDFDLQTWQSQGKPPPLKGSFSLI